MPAPKKPAARRSAALKRAQASYDAARTNSKVRLTPAASDLLDELRGEATRAGYVTALLEAEALRRKRRAKS